MSRKIVVVRESFDWITENDITTKEFEELIQYLEEKYPNEPIIELRYKRLRFINYVGVIVCSGVRYEILPKINLSKKDERKALISMLSHTNFLPISFYEKIKNGEDQSDLLTVFLKLFLERLFRELNKGPYVSYETNTENLTVLKGKLELSQHTRFNAFQRTRVYCSYDEYTVNNSLNQMFKAALFIVRKETRLHTLKLQLERCLNYLESVDLIDSQTMKRKKIFFNRKNERFKDAALLAKMIIDHASIYSNGEHSSSFSFLFPMNLLFEKYIEAALYEAIGNDKVVSQHNEKRLLRNRKTGYRNILLKPDFVIDSQIILDTKWKTSTYQDRLNYSQADIYQMYAYITSYTNAKRCILLYPKEEVEMDYPIWEVMDTSKTIEMQTVRIDDFRETVNELKLLLNC